MYEDRKEGIRKRLRRARYPSRSSARFDEDPDHNPLVLENCPRCHGRGTVCHRVGPDTEALDQCPDCAGSGTNDQVVRYFTNDAEPMNVSTYQEGWVRCLCCGWRFALYDQNAWTGKRHIRCGQRLVVS